MAKFITLTTDRSSAIGAKIRVNADMMIGYGPADDAGRQGWSWIEVNDQCGGVRYVMETPEQIDAMLGVTESGEAIAAALEAEADRMDDDATAIHNGTMRGDMKLRAKAFRDAAKIARAARGEG